MLQRIMNDVLAARRRQHWAQDFDLEVRFKSGRVVILPYVRHDPGFLVLEDDEHPEGFRDTWLMAGEIETVRPIWR